jgi:Zn-dependent protease
MAEYYKVDGRKITLREYWNIARSWQAIVAWIAARLGAPLQAGVAFRQPGSVSEMEIPESELSPQAKAKLQPLVEQCLQLGFHSPRYYLHESLRRDVRTFFIAMLHRSGEFTLRLMHTLASNASPPVENVLAVLLSELNDGTFFFTSDQRPKFRSPPGILNNRLIGASPIQLIESHQQKLAALGARNPPRPVLSTAALDDVWNRYEKMSVEFQVGRGLYVRMAPEEVEGQQKLVEAARTMTTGGVQHADVLVELDQLQNKKGGWGNAILILVVSMFLFVGAGSRQWSWDYVLMLVPILFVHELGHYVAMRAFHYRNLRMFFIPFFGAAVAGQHYNVPGWKKVIVSMMGPAPGIVLGAMIGGVGLVLHEPWLIKTALVALVLNGINLLPVLPLDGGWVFHALLFSRHHLLDAAFRVVAAIALIAGGMFSTDKILMYLGVFMLIGIPAAYRMARITGTLRERGVPTGSPDDQTVPTETAVAIIDELKKSLPKAHTNKMLAQQTLQIFEILNARPPGWLATIGLLFAYFTSLGMALVFAGVFIFGQRGDLRAMLSGVASQPKRALDCGTVSSWDGAPVAGVTEAASVTIIANFPKRHEALSSFQGLTNRLPASATAKLFGDSVLLTLPAGEANLRKQWFDELQRQTKVVFVDGSNTPATLSLSCQTTDDKSAKEIETELTEYFSNDTGRSLIPPWLPGDRRTAEQRAAHQLARKTHLRAQAGKWDGYNDPKMIALQKRISEARRQGDDAEATALTQQLTELAEDLGKQRLNKLKAGEEGPVDATIIDLFNALPPISTRTNREAFRKTQQEISRRMGQLPLVNDRGASSDGRFSTRGGLVSSKGRALHLSWLSFQRLSDGAPALIDWLCAKGCADLKYDLRSGAELDSGEEDSGEEE